MSATNQVDGMGVRTTGEINKIEMIFVRHIFAIDKYNTYVEK